MESVRKLFEDKSLLVIGKPSGLVVHSDQRTEEATLCDWVASEYPELAKVGGVHMLDMGRTEARWGIVNRLDREVSGCIMIAKDEDTFEELARQFRDREVVKKYIAVVYGKVGTEGGVFEIDESIGRHRKDPRRWAIGVEARNTKRDAHTVCRVLKSTDEYSVLELQPITGRTHQLRLHVMSLGTAIVGDGKYFPNDERFIKVKSDFDSENKISRILLHALSVEFVHPVSKQKILASSELPVEFKDFI
jgi:23S rRNA pseudouridine1911/1915/1917 synthase